MIVPFGRGCHGLTSQITVSARAFAAATFCPMLEQDILEMRKLIEERRNAFKDGRKRFVRGGNFSAGDEQWATRRFGQERSEMKTEEKKIKQLEERLDFLLQRHRRHCGSG
ncbi:unnamed protein product [Polarella glacialis]|uniref:Uncharacterized protein n=1 Tax=Polarella glacialis TaxID=89957 RepID=A0A813HQU7_POLGL|nr:unnamed protein product [Polarella glacialis]